jgi:hypothetical protein
VQLRPGCRVRQLAFDAAPVERIEHPRQLLEVPEDLERSELEVALTSNRVVLDMVVVQVEQVQQRDQPIRTRRTPQKVGNQGASKPLGQGCEIHLDATRSGS